MAQRIGIVKLILGIAGLIVAVQIITMLHFSSLHSNDINMKFRKSIPEGTYRDALGPRRKQIQEAVEIFGGLPSAKLQVM